MKLFELEATFIRHERKPFTDAVGLTRDTDYSIPVSTFAEAHGIRFICPKSYIAHGGKIGAHQTEVWFQGSQVPPDRGLNKAGVTVRWNASGTGLDDLTLTPSIQEEDEHCMWHGFVTNGDAA